jgi:hypothetical protein
MYLCIIIENELTMWGVDSEVDGPLGDALVGARLPVGLLLDLPPDFLKVKKFLSRKKDV